MAELRLALQRLTGANGKIASDQPRLALASAVLDSTSPDAALTQPADRAFSDASEAISPAAQAAGAPPIVAGWNGEHFFLKSSDGNFTAMPIGYFNSQYNIYKGDPRRLSGF